MSKSYFPRQAVLLLLLAALIIALAFDGCKSLPVETALQPLDPSAPAPPGIPLAPDPPLPDVNVSPISEYIATLGIGAIVMVVIEVLKRFGAIPDGTAGKWATIANIVIFAVLTVAGVFGFDPAAPDVQQVINLLNRVGQAVLLILGSPLLWRVLRKLKIISPAPNLRIDKAWKYEGPPRGA